MLQNPFGTEENTEGQEAMSLSVSLDDAVLLTPQLRALRQQIALKVPKVCGWHEVRAAKMDLGVDVSDEQACQILCEREFRERNANCAHVINDDRPDPYCTEIKALITMGILEGSPWRKWLDVMNFSIVNEDAGQSRSLARGQTTQSDGYITRMIQMSQGPNVNTLLAIQQKLLGIIDRVIEKITILACRPASGCSVEERSLETPSHP